MSTNLPQLFRDFDRGVLSRRQLLQALGMAALVQPPSAFAQGQCGDALEGTPPCDPTPAKAPFAPRNATFDSVCWGIDRWDAKKVEAELEKRGA